MNDPFVDLQFQDFGVTPSTKPDAPVDQKESKVREQATTFHFTDFPANGGDDHDENGKNDTGELLKSTPDGKSASSPSFWSFAYYQQFFDVDTDVVVRRVINSMVPRVGTNFILHHIRPTPDLYGPWWISLTLIFTIAIASNLGGYFALSDDKADYHWSLEFGVVSAAATAIFAYVWLVPLFLYGLFWWRKSEVNFGFTEILCAYGYSLSIYVPISLLWVIPFSWFQWVLIAVGLASSGLVLVMSLWPAVSHDKRVVAFSVMIGVFFVNALLAIGFKMFFFHGIHYTNQSTPINNTIMNQAATVSSIGVTTNKVNSTN